MEMSEKSVEEYAEKMRDITREEREKRRGARCWTSFRKSRLRNVNTRTKCSA